MAAIALHQRPKDAAPAIIAVCGEHQLPLTNRGTKRWITKLREWGHEDAPIAFFAPPGEPRLRRLRERIQPDPSAWKYSPSQQADVFFSGCGQPSFLGGSDVRRQRRILGAATSRGQLATLSPQPLATLARARGTSPGCTRPATAAPTPDSSAPAETTCTTTAGRNKRASQQSSDRQSVAWQPPRSCLSPLSRLGKPWDSSCYPKGARQSRPQLFTPSARQPRSGPSLPCFDSARQTRSLLISESCPTSRWTLIPVDLPRRTSPRPARPWHKGEAPVDPRRRTPSPTTHPATRGTRWDSCPYGEIQDLLDSQLRPAPLLSPLRDPYPDIDVEELLQGPRRPVLSPLREPCPDPELADILRWCHLSPPLSPL